MTITGTNGDATTVRDAARHYLRCGVLPIPNRRHDKKPGNRQWDGAGWPDLNVTDADVDRLFDLDGNIGLALGAPSGGLVDIDLDSPEAIAAAPHLLPRTALVGGRASAPRSHHWYVVESPPDKASDKLRDPCITDRDRNLLLEFRSTGGQSIVAPSVYGAEPEKGHPVAEPSVWASHGEPARVSVDVLATAVRAVAAASLFARYWPGGGRHDASLALAGGLLRAGWLEEAVETFIVAVCAAARDTDVSDRLRSIRDTADRLRADKKAVGFPTLVELPGAEGPTIVNAVRGWLGVTTDPGVSWGGNSAHSVNCARGWPDAIPLSAPPAVPSFPVEVLPEWLREWAAAVATQLQVPADLPAGLGLGLVGGGIGRKVVVRPRPGFTEPTSVYAMCALPPGERKTQTFKMATAPVLDLERELIEAAAPAILEKESEHRIAEGRVKHLESKMAKAEVCEKAALVEELKTAREELLKAVVPARPPAAVHGGRHARGTEALAHPAGRADDGGDDRSQVPGEHHPLCRPPELRRVFEGARRRRAAERAHRPGAGVGHRAGLHLHPRPPAGGHPRAGGERRAPRPRVPRPVVLPVPAEQRRRATGGRAGRA